MKPGGRSSKAEATGRANRIRGGLGLTSNPNFIEDYGIWHSTGRTTSYVSYTFLGYEIQLRFVNDGEWKAICHHFKIEITFPNQTPDQIQIILNDWLRPYIERATSPDAQLRQLTPAVQELAQRHNIPVTLADEITLERGF